MLLGCAALFVGNISRIKVNSSNELFDALSKMEFDFIQHSKSGV